MIISSGRFSLLEEETQDLIAEIKNIQQQAETEFIAGQHIIKRLGAHLRPDGRAEIGFWTPELQENDIPTERVFLECLTPLASIDFGAETQQLTFRRNRINLLRDGDFTWAVVDGLLAGNQETIGTLYQLVYQSHAGEWITLHDHLAYSIPFGAFAPAEFYDMNSMFDNRQDKDHFHNQLDTQADPDGIQRVQFPSNILQIHVAYATESGSIAGLTRLYQAIADKIQLGERLSPAEQNFIAYDAIQLMPIEPIIEYEGRHNLWSSQGDSLADEIEVTLHKPDMTNWGYDIVISGSSAINPTLLETRRPHELLALIETCHNFPNKPIKVMLDIVYGHIDNQALELLNKEYFAGSNMYGQNVNFLHPMVRAAVLEMMRRKHNYGVDGIRVDGAQDFKWWNPETDEMVHDNDFLHLMNDIELDVAGVRYRPWMIFEDGRPWPRDDWELASTYREVTKLMPNVWQWGPLTFAHNTPFLFTFWMSKWWRIREMADIGREWITGCANHDTLRRGSQVPTDSRINTFLGDNLPEIIRKAYDNPAGKMFDYGMMPGIPMDFVNGSFRAPWGFIRNTDDKYGVKVVSEETLWLHWRMDKMRYSQPHIFTRLKDFGFSDLDHLRRFTKALDHTVQATDYDLHAIVRLLNNMTPPLSDYELDIATLKAIAKAFMDDVHDYCNISHYWDAVAPEQAKYNLKLRNFRRERTWLINNLTEDETLNYLHPTDGAAIFYGMRISPENGEKILFLANMEGAPHTIIPANLPIANLDTEGWEVALATPNLDVNSITESLTLSDSEGVIFVKQ